MKRYLTSAGEERNIENIPAKDLNLHMFLHGDKEERWRPIRTHNTDFISSKSTTINSTLLYMDQLLISWKTRSFRFPERPFPQEKGSYYAILARETARPLSDAEEDLVFERGKFGDQDHEVLQRTAWWLLSLHFGFRARDESRKLKWGGWCKASN